MLQTVINIISWFTFQLFRMKNITTLYIRSFAVQCEIIISHFTAKDFLKKGRRLEIIGGGGGGEEAGPEKNTYVTSGVK